MPETDEMTTTTHGTAPGAGRKERAYHTLGTVLATIIVIVLVLLFWHSCGFDPQDGRISSGGGIIQTLDDLEVIDGGVAVWLRPGATVEQVLDRNGLADSSHTSFGDGTYVIGIDDEDVPGIVARLKKDPGLYDAGFLYTDPEP